MSFFNVLFPFVDPSGTAKEVGKATGFKIGGGGSPGSRDPLPFKPGMGSEGIAAPAAPELKPFELGNPYKADLKAPAYEKIRNDVISQNSTAKSDAMGALERKFAAIGNLNSGSYIKQSQILDDKYQQNASKALSDAELGFQQQESAKEFQSQQAYDQRAYGASAQGRQEQIALGQQGFDNQTKLRQLDLALYASQQNAQDSAFNAEMAKYQAEHSGGLFGSGGFLGLGL